MTMFRVKFESDSTEVFFTTEAKAKKYIKDMCDQDGIPYEEGLDYFHLDEIETLE